MIKISPRQLTIIGLVAIGLVGCKENEVKRTNWSKPSITQEAGILVQEQERVFEVSDQTWGSTKVTKTINDVRLSATQVPNAYYFLKRGIELTDSLLEATAQERIFEFDIDLLTRANVFDSEQMSKSIEDPVQYLSFDVQRDMHVLTSSGDTLACEGVLFERNFNVAPHKRILLFFSGIPPLEEVQLVYNDRLFDNGILRYAFKQPKFNISDQAL